jgi:hypothetical protein
MAKVLATYSASLPYLRHDYHPDSALPAADSPDEIELASVPLSSIITPQNPDPDTNLPQPLLL